MHVDGFRFDLASALTRGNDGKVSLQDLFPLGEKHASTQCWHRYFGGKESIRRMKTQAAEAARNESVQVSMDPLLMRKMANEPKLKKLRLDPQCSCSKDTYTRDCRMWNEENLDLPLLTKPRRAKFIAEAWDCSWPDGDEVALDSQESHARHSWEFIQRGA